MVARTLMRAAILAGLILATCSNHAVAETISRSFALNYEDEMLAERHGTKITLFDVEGRLQDVPREDRAGVLSSPERIARILNDLLVNYGMAEQAMQRGLLDEPEVQAEIFYRTMYVLARREQQAVLSEQQLDDYSVRAREYYLANPEEFRNLEELSFTHVLFQAPAPLRPAALGAATGLLETLDQPAGLDTVSLEGFEIEGVTSVRGSLDKVTPNQLDARFAAGLARMQPGDVAVIESSFGAHVVRLDARTEGGVRTFDEVRSMLENRARQRHHDQILRQRVEAFYAAPLNLVEGAVERIIESQMAVSDD